MDIIGMGALNYDKFFKVKKIAKGDEESYILELKEESGGSAANTIVALARLGIKTGFVGKLAEDAEGNAMLSDFKQDGVDIEKIIISKDGRSGMAFVFVDELGERGIYLHPGVNNHLEFKDVNLDYINKSKILHITSFVSENQLKVQKEIIKNLNSLKLSFAPGHLLASKGISKLKPILENSKILFINEKELKILTQKDVENGAKELLKMGIKIIALTQGEKGCTILTKDKKIEVSAFKIEVVDTSGAGDAFAAGFLMAFLENKSLEECGRTGNKVASLCIQKIGARSGLPYKKDIYR